MLADRGQQRAQWKGGNAPPRARETCTNHLPGFVQRVKFKSRVCGAWTTSLERSARTAHLAGFRPSRHTRRSIHGTLGRSSRRSPPRLARRRRRAPPFPKHDRAQIAMGMRVKAAVRKKCKSGWVAWREGKKSG
eukprot:352743-Chlamydomonas_euryale.AAC.6